jgi:tRNA(Ile)-lysidine synthase
MEPIGWTYLCIFMNSHATTDLPTQFERAWPPHSWYGSHLVLAVSGGADSVAMLRAVVAIKQSHGGDGRLYVAHLNHGLRGSEADADEVWMRNLCERLQLPLEIGRSDVAEIAKLQGDGVEAAARGARYEFLTKTAERLGARFVVSAHTADDQVETVLHRIMRGTGIAGLTGIPAKRRLSESVSLVRPLLGVRRGDVIAYLDAIRQDYRTDTTNVDLGLTRNRLRHELLPALREYYNADVDTALLRLAQQASETQQLIADAAAAAAAAGRCVTYEYESADARDSGPRRVQRIQINCRAFESQPSLVIREVCKAAWVEAGWPLQAMGFDQWRQLAELITGQSEASTINLPGGVRAHLSQRVLTLASGGLG